MSPHQIQFARALDLMLTPICATLTAAGRSRGVDADGRELPGLKEKLARVPDQIEVIAGWCRNHRAGLDAPAPHE